MEEKLKKAQADLEKTKASVEKITEGLAKAQGELKAKPKDEKIQKKVEGLTVNLQKAEEKQETCEKTIKEIEAGKLIRLKVASKTERDSYFRCGLQFGKSATELEVSEAVASTLKADAWLTVEEVK